MNGDLMKIFTKLLIYIASIAAFFGSSQAMEINNKYFYAEYEKRTPDEELVKKYTANPEFMAHVTAEMNKAEAWWTSKGPYVFKYNNAISRVRGSLLIRECAQEFDLDAISAPEKFFKIRDGKIVTTSDGPIVFARGIKSNNIPFSLKQIQQLCIIAEKTGLADIHDGNIFNSQEGIAYTIDTEIRSFCVPGNLGCCATEYNFVTFLERMKKLLTMEDEAKDWLAQEIESQKHKNITAPGDS